MRKALATTFLGLALLGFLALTPAYAHSVVRSHWVRNYTSGFEPEFAFAFATAVDGSGNVYVAGSSYDANGVPDYVTVKYSSSGETLWVQRHNGPDDNWDVATDIALDSAGNVYVTGHSFGVNDFDYVTLKYSPAGAQEWIARYNGPGNGDDWPQGLAVDASGNVYVTGWSPGVGTFYDYATVKYSTSGTPQWVARYNAPGNTRDRAQAVGVDGSGNVYVTGDSGEGSDNHSDYVTVKYNSSGAQQWVARYESSYDYATDLGVDQQGNVFVTGYSQGSGTSDDYVTIKYNPAGQQGWLDRFHGGLGQDRPNDLTTDSSGNVYVTGETVESGTGGEFGTIKYSPTGARQWVARYNGPVDFGTEVGRAVAVDAAGNVYVTGESGGDGTGTDFATVKYSASGAQQWVARYNGAGDTYDDPTALAVDGSGRVYVTGRSSRTGGSVWTTIKYVQISTSTEIPGRRGGLALPEDPRSP
jgi:uncharacterized delta-60 repeat protein